jgi:hypothetical protein
MAIPPLFSIQLTDLFSDQVKRWKKENNKAALNKYFSQLTQTHGRDMAEYTKKRFSDVLKPGHKFNVGASGKSSENFSIEGGQNGFLYEWVVLEGGLSGGANMFIRRGFGRVKGDRHIPRENIRLWMAQKKIFFRDDVTGKKTSKSQLWYSGDPGDLKSTRYFLSRSKKGKAYGKAENKAIGDPVLDKIIHKLEMSGSKFTHWTELYPVGKGRFDYVAYVVKQQKGFNALMVNGGRAMLTAYVSYLTSGGGKSGTATFQSFSSNVTDSK